MQEADAHCDPQLRGPRAWVSDIEREEMAMFKEDVRTLEHIFLVVGYATPPVPFHSREDALDWMKSPTLDHPQLMSAFLANYDPSTPMFSRGVNRGHLNDWCYRRLQHDVRPDPEHDRKVATIREAGLAWGTSDAAIEAEILALLPSPWCALEETSSNIRALHLKKQCAMQQIKVSPNECSRRFWAQETEMATLRLPQRLRATVDFLSSRD